MPNPFHAKSKRLFADAVAPAKHRPHFEPPVPTMPSTSLKASLSAFDTEEAKRVRTNGRLIFHSVGDTGGVRGDDWQRAVADAMTAQYTFDATGHVQDAPDNPSFFYHLGDVVYWNGLPTQYANQFYEPYKFYPALIFAIPGNHDGDTSQRFASDPPDPYPSLRGFQMNFVDDTPRRRSAYRDTLNQPYYFWTLDAELVTIIGLYGNVDGTLDALPGGPQQAFLNDQLTAARPDKPVIIAVHQPPYSLDNDHGGYPEILAAIDEAAANTGRLPNLILSGHVHNYQRFTRQIGTRSIPYIVAGNGGIAVTHKQVHTLTRQDGVTPVPTPLDTNEPGVTLRAYNEFNPGFLKLTVDAVTITVEYFDVNVDGDDQAALFDSITIDWQNYVVAENTGNPSRSAL